VVTTGALDEAAVIRLARAHDLIVVASGRAALADMFPRIAERSPCTAPQRRLVGALVRGVRLPDVGCFTQRVVAGAGEVCEFQLLGPDGPVTAVLIFAIPGGALEPITRLGYDDDPRAFDRALYDVLATYAPEVRARIADPARFGVVSARDVCRGGVTPVVRRGLRKLAHGHALALGDAHVTMDPLTAQGGNMAGKAAWRLGELVVERVTEGAPFDDAFCARAEDTLWRLVQPAAEWNLAALEPPPTHVLELVAAAARNPAIAMEFTANFDDPARQWEILRSPEATHAFIQLYSR
jgi:2-polyprenyl-6-methoxyphenol hydroxylase-like FAD-dependent oxidoreductase